MDKRQLVAAACVALLAVPAAAQSSVYKWTDKDGKVHFSDTPPPLDAKASSQKNMGGGYVETENLPYATQMAVKKNPVTLYTGPGCGDPCNNGRDLLSRRGVPYSERDAQNDAGAKDDLQKLNGALEVPYLVVGSNKVKGFEEGQWHSALDGGGYPRTRLPGQGAAPKRDPYAGGAAATAPPAPPGGDAKPQ